MVALLLIIIVMFPKKPHRFYRHLVAVACCQAHVAFALAFVSAHTWGHLTSRLELGDLSVSLDPPISSVKTFPHFSFAMSFLAMALLLVVCLIFLSLVVLERLKLVHFYEYADKSGAALPPFGQGIFGCVYSDPIECAGSVCLPIVPLGYNASHLGKHGCAWTTLFVGLWLLQFPVFPITPVCCNFSQCVLHLSLRRKYGFKLRCYDCLAACVCTRKSWRSLVTCSPATACSIAQDRRAIKTESGVGLSTHYTIVAQPLLSPVPSYDSDHDEKPPLTDETNLGPTRSLQALELEYIA